MFETDMLLLIEKWYHPRENQRKLNQDKVIFQIYSSMGLANFWSFYSGFIVFITVTCWHGLRDFLIPGLLEPLISRIGIFSFVQIRPPSVFDQGRRRCNYYL